MLLGIMGICKIYYNHANDNKSEIYCFPCKYILYIVYNTEGNIFQVLNDSSIPISGFDFLDQW